MDVLADHVGGREYLIIVQIERAWYQVGCLEHDTLARFRAEEQWLRGPGPIQGRLHIFFQHRDTRLRIMPTALIDRHIELDVCGFVLPKRHRVVGDVKRVGAWVGIGRAGLFPPAIDGEQDAVLRNITVSR